MKKDKNYNEKILESKKIIREAKEKIRTEKRNIRKKKIKRFKKSKFGSAIMKIFFIFDERDSYSFNEVFSITIISLILGVFATLSVFTVLFRGRNYFRLAKELNKFYDVYEAIIDNYYGDVDKDKLVESAIRGMVSSVGDEYTNYGDAEATATFDEMVNGTYEGIGCTIQAMGEDVIVIDVYSDGPASKCGLQQNDKIIAVNGLMASELGINGIAEYIKKEAVGDIQLTIIRDNEEQLLTIKKGKVEMPTVSSDIYLKNGEKVGYINISVFSSVTAKQFKHELEKLENDGIDDLVIDVRSNNGGYLTTVSEIISYLLPKGSVMYQVQKGNNKETIKDKTAEKRDYNIAVLTNGESASASEILAAAIKESYHGFVVGTKTYGKGTVQQIRKLSDGSMIKYTTQNWLTPNGNWINEVGVKPTNEIELDEAYYSDPVSENDNQLQRALDLVSE